MLTCPPAVFTEVFLQFPPGEDEPVAVIVVGEEGGFSMQYPAKSIKQALAIGSA